MDFQFFGRGIAATVFVLLTACTTFPTQELTSYRTAFSAFSEQAEQLIIQFKAACERHPEECESAKLRHGYAAAAPAASGLGFPSSVSFGAQATGNEPYVARRELLALVQGYNDALLLLAEGKSETEVQDSLTGVMNGFNKLQKLAGLTAAIPMVGQVAGLIGPVVSALEAANNRAQFKQALIDGAPIIEEILTQFLQDGQQMYALTAGEMTTAVADARIANDPHVESAIGLIRVIDGNGGMRAARAKSLNEMLNTSFGVLWIGRGFPLNLNESTDNQCRDELVCSQLLQTAALLTEASRQHAAKVDSQLAYYHWVNEFGGLIEVTRTALRTLQQEAVNPSNLRADANALLALAFSTKSRWEEYQAARAVN